MQHPVAIGADNGEVSLGVKDHLARPTSELSQRCEVMSLDIPLTVRTIPPREVKAAYTAVVPW